MTQEKLQALSTARIRNLLSGEHADCAKQELERRRQEHDKLCGPPHAGKGNEGLRYPFLGEVPL